MLEDEMFSRIEDYFHILPLGEKSLDFGKILSTDTSLKIIESVYNSDSKVGLSASEISNMLGVGRTTVIYHLGRMHESGLVKINPNLENEEKWKKFWKEYRERSTNLSREQFERLHTARMSGVKLFVPTKKGFLILPSSDVRESRSMVKEALSSITLPAIEGDYKKMRKSTSVLGALGLIFIALSFFFQIPYFQQFQGMELSGAFDGPQMQESTFDYENKAAAAPPSPEPPNALIEGGLAEKIGQEETRDIGITEESAMGLESKKEPERIENTPVPAVDEMEVSKESEIDFNGQTRIISPGFSNYISFLPQIFLFVGIFFIGSFLSFLLYQRYRRA
jgi:hypothetical protein